MAKVSTSITTHPIADLELTTVTICPPKSSNTALYHDLVKAGNKSLSEKDKLALRKAATEIFLETPYREYAKMMLSTSNPRNLDQVYQGFHSLPMHFN